VSSVLAQITYEAWLEAKPRLGGLRGIALRYIGAATFFVFLFALAGTSTAPHAGTRSLIAIILITAVFQALVVTSGDRLFRSWSRVAESNDAHSSSQENGRAKSLAQLKQKIVGYVARLPDWDGMEGTAPRADAIADALTFIDELLDGFPIPDRVHAPGDGEVMFQWLRPRTLIEIGFYGDDTISWYARLPDHGVSSGDDPFDRRAGRHLPRPLADALGSIQWRAR
jgi:hypothetical protein